MAAIRLSPPFSDAVHGTRGGGNLHALATAINDGFMSSEYAAQLDQTPIAYITYQMGGTPGSGVVVDWADVEAFAAAAAGTWTLYIDNTFAICEVPATADTDFRYLCTIKYSGAESVVPGDPKLLVKDGAILRGLGNVGTGAQLVCESQTVTPIRLSAEGGITILREGGRIINAQDALVPAIEVSSSNYIMAFLEAGIIGVDVYPPTVPVLKYTAIGGFHILFQLVNSNGGNGIQDNIIEADATTFIINGHDSTAKLRDQSLFFSGTMLDNPIGRSEWTQWQQGDTPTRPTDATLGQPYFDTDLGHPIWWSGTDWVDATGALV